VRPRATPHAPARRVPLRARGRSIARPRVGRLAAGILLPLLMRRAICCSFEVVGVVRGVSAPRGAGKSGPPHSRTSIGRVEAHVRGEVFTHSCTYPPPCASTHTGGVAYEASATHEYDARRDAQWGRPRGLAHRTNAECAPAALAARTTAEARCSTESPPRACVDAIDQRDDRGADGGRAAAARVDGIPGQCHGRRARCDALHAVSAAQRARVQRATPPRRGARTAAAPHAEGEEAEGAK
jgi:hypothetical protein